MYVWTVGSEDVIEALQGQERRKLKRKVIAERGIHQGQKSRKQKGKWQRGRTKCRRNTTRRKKTSKKVRGKRTRRREQGGRD